MTCKNCGNEIRDDARFCPHCGAVNNSDPGSGLPQGAAPYGASAYAGPEASVSGGGKKKGLLIGGAVAAAAVVVLLAAAVSGLFASPKGQVEKALAKTTAAYSAAEKALDMPDTAQWQREQTIGQRMSLELKNINSQLAGYDMSSLSGLGLYLDTGYNGPARKLHFDLGAYWGDDSLLSFQMAADDAEFYFGSPQLFGADYYGMNTETLGTDLAALTGDDSVEELSFNLFDLMDLALEKVDQEAAEQTMKEAGQQLWKAVTVKKEGSKTLTVNGTSTKTTLYRITVPQEALAAYVDAIAGVMSSLNYYDLYAELFQAMGMPEEELEDVLSGLEELDVYGELAERLKDALAELGDVELDVCLSGGYVSAVLYEDRINGSDVSFALYLGGGEQYVDKIGMELNVDDTTIDLKSSGDHGLKSGVFTDETAIRVRERGSTLVRITSELSYDPRGASDNLQWQMDVSSSGLSLFTLETEGGLSASKDAIDLRMEDVILRVMGMEVCTLSLDYHADRNPSAAQIGSPKMISQLSQMELLGAALDIQSNAEAWVSDMEELFTTRLPEELLWDLMYSY